jgi:Domain of unknown function (DUF4365)
LITKQHRQEDLCIAYVQAVVSGAGMILDLVRRDYGIDGWISRIVNKNGRLVPSSGLPLRVQLKSSAHASFDNDHLKYALNERNYDILSDKKATLPSVLVLLLLPTHEEEWIEQDDERLILRKCAFWQSLRGLPETKNDSRVTISIPRKNLWNAENLLGIMNRIEQGDLL